MEYRRIFAEKKMVSLFFFYISIDNETKKLLNCIIN